MGRVKCKKISIADFAALGHKDPETLYFVNSDGNFDEQNMDDTGDIYLGDKLLTDQPVVPSPFNPADPMGNPQGVFFVEADGTSSVWTATLQGLTAYYVGLRLAVFNTVAGTTSTTLNVNGLGAVPICRYGTTELESAHPAKSLLTLTYATVAEGQYAWVMDSYTNTTYTVMNAYIKLGGTMTGSYGIKRKGLCAFQANGCIGSLFNGSGTGNKTAAQVDFALGLPLFHRASDSNVSNGIALSTQNFYVSYNGIDIRYSSNLTNEIGTGHSIYLEVDINAAAGTYRPTSRLLVTDAQLQQGKHYILVGWQTDTTSWQSCSLLAHNPVFYCDGSRLVPYDTWRSSALQTAIANLRAFTDRRESLSADINLKGSLVSVWQPLPFMQAELSATTLDIDLRATLLNTDNDGVSVEVWIETGHLEEEGGTNHWVADSCIASAEATLPNPKTTISREPAATVVLSASIDGPQQTSTGIRLCFLANGGAKVRQRTVGSLKPLATTLRIRAFNQAEP